MKLDRNFTTHENEQTTRDLISQYLLQQGYQQTPSQPNLVFERGSNMGSMTSFSTKRWKVIVTVQTRPSNEGGSQVSVTFDINTTGQWVVKREINFWNKELEGLIASACGSDVEIPMQAQLESKLVLEKRHSEGSKWFYWIAGLSVINSVILLMGGSINFLVGLGITQIVDAVSFIISEEVSPNAVMVVKSVAFLFNLGIAGIFVLLGLLSKRSKWGFIIGMVIYGLDALIFLIVPDFLSIAFHCLALFGLFGGLKAFGQIQKQKALQPAIV